MAEAAGCEAVTRTMLADGLWGERGGEEGEERERKRSERMCGDTWLVDKAKRNTNAHESNALI